MTNECRADSVYCESCGTRFAVEDLQDDQYIALQEQHRCPQLEAELGMLLRVKEFYTRHAVAEGRTQLPASASVQSADSEIQRQHCSEVAADRIEISPDEAPPQLPNLSKTDEEVVEWLKQTGFDLGPRLSFVSERVLAYRNSVGRTQCPRCKDGKLRLDTEHWIDPGFID
jgi:hypothetical protein